MRAHLVRGEAFELRPAGEGGEELVGDEDVSLVGGQVPGHQVSFLRGFQDKITKTKYGRDALKRRIY